MCGAQRLRVEAEIRFDGAFTGRRHRKGFNEKEDNTLARSFYHHDTCHSIGVRLCKYSYYTGTNITDIRVDIYNYNYSIANTGTNAHADPRTFTNTHTDAYTNADTCTFNCTGICTHTNANTHANAYTYTYSNTHTHANSKYNSYSFIHK